MTMGIISFSVTVKYLVEPKKEQNYSILEDEYIDMTFENSNFKNWDKQSTSNNTLNNRNGNVDNEPSSIVVSESEKKELGIFQTIKLIFTKSSWIAISCYCMLSLATMLFFTVSI